MVISLALPGTVSATRQDAPAAGPFTPGQITTFKQTIPINFVFIGYKPSDINTTDFSQWLPAAYKPIVRYPTFYGLPGRDMGLQYNFSYRYIYKDNTFARNFFFYLRSIGRQGDLTYHQEAYNAMANNYVDVNGPVLYIDGPSVEKWLANQLKLGERGYTLVFINWYNRPDFKFHVYTKTNEPDFDTLFNFGDELSSRKTIAWGGGDSASGSTISPRDRKPGLAITMWTTQTWTAIPSPTIACLRFGSMPLAGIAPRPNSAATWA
jgi:hypothetical protein